MDDPKIVSILRFLLLIVQNDNCISVDEAAKCLHTTRRTIYRYINTLNEVGFDITTNPVSLRWNSYAINQLSQITDASFISRQKIYLDVQSAVQQKRKAIFENYSSGHRGQCADYRVEPYRVSDDGQFVYAYDETAGMCKVFKLARIDSVGILDEPWEYTDCHKAMITDAFNMSGEQTTRVKMRLNMHACRLLLEEFPRVATHPLCTLERDGDTFILTAEVCSLKGIGRFYLGLIDCITIIDAPQLQAYVRKLIKTYKP